MKGVLKEKDMRAKSAQTSIHEAQEVLSDSIGKTTGAYEKLNIERSGLPREASMVAAESSETIDFILANFEEASTELGNSNDALQNIAEDIGTLSELDAEAKVITDSFEEFVKGTLDVLEAIDNEINDKGRIISDVADKTEEAANRAESLADRVKLAQETQYENRRMARQAREQAQSDASEAAEAYKEAVRVSDSMKEALERAVELKNSAEDQMDDARRAYSEAQTKADLAREELNIIMTENGLDAFADGLDGDIKIAVEKAQAALAKANEAADVAAIDLIGRQYELAEAEGKLAVAQAKEGYVQEEATQSLRNVLEKTVEAIKSTNESAISAKAAVTQAYDEVMKSADDMKRINLEARLDYEALELAKARRDNARAVYLSAIEAKGIAQDNVKRAKEAAQTASELAGQSFNYSNAHKNSIIGNALNSLFRTKKDEKKQYSHNRA